MLRVVGWSADFSRRNPIARAVGELYQGRYGSPMTEIAASTFTATLTLADAIDRADSADPELIRAALRQTSLPANQTIMPWDGVRFDTAGQNRLATGVLEQSARGGFRLVFPRELGAGQLAWPVAGG
jgi:branched-chain amino acid transport system substrate-binding protein